MMPTMVRLAGEFSVIAPDLPGFGLSDKPVRALGIGGMADALTAWMRANGLASAVLVGNSIGCQVAVDVACRYPECVEGLVLGSPTIDPSARSMLRQIGRVILDAPREAISLDLLALYDYLEAGIPRVLATLRHALDDPIERKLPQVRAPAWVVRGERDPIVPAAWGRRMAELLPRGELVVVGGAPHGMNYSTPTAFARVIRHFMRERER
jgi:pimeloyl-ACP methyl ester carboxylesterase